MFLFYFTLEYVTRLQEWIVPKPGIIIIIRMINFLRPKGPKKRPKLTIVAEIATIVMLLLLLIQIMLTI